MRMVKYEINSRLITCLMVDLEQCTLAGEIEVYLRLTSGQTVCYNTFPVMAACAMMGMSDVAMTLDVDILFETLEMDGKIDNCRLLTQGSPDCDEVRELPSYDQACFHVFKLQAGGIARVAAQTNMQPRDAEMAVYIEYEGDTRLHLYPKFPVGVYLALTGGLARAPISRGDFWTIMARMKACEQHYASSTVAAPKNDACYYDVAIEAPRIKNVTRPCSGVGNFDF